MGRPAGANRNTKERLMEAAAELFSQAGFGATSVKSVADAVGIKDASLYNHFLSKEALFSDVLAREQAYFGQVMGEHGLFSDSVTGRVAAVAPDSVEAFEDFMLGLWEPFFADERIVRFRQLLVLCAPQDEDARQMLGLLFLDRPLGFAGNMVEHLCAAGAMAQCNPRVAAYEVCGPAIAMMDQRLPWAEAQRRLRSQYRAFGRYHAL